MRFMKSRRQKPDLKRGAGGRTGRDRLPREVLLEHFERFGAVGRTGLVNIDEHPGDKLKLN